MRKKNETYPTNPPKKPTVDTLKFTLVRPSKDFKLVDYDTNYAVWYNKREEDFIQKKGILLSKIVLTYNEEEQICFFNYGKLYLSENIDSHPDYPDTIPEKLEITYSIPTKEYTIDYNYSPIPSNPKAWGWEIYHTRREADSILKTWGAPPLKDWK